MFAINCWAGGRAIWAGKEAMGVDSVVESLRVREGAIVKDSALLWKRYALRPA